MNTSKKLENISSQGIPILLELIQKYLDRQILLPTYKNDAYTRHYLMEIIRNKNKIQFILNKTLRSMKIDKKQMIVPENLLFYTVYAFFWEKKGIDKLKNEILPLSLKKEQIQFFKQFYERLTNFIWEYALKGKPEIEQFIYHSM